MVRSRRRPVTQSVHYNPGDNRQVFELTRGQRLDVPSAAKPGERGLSPHAQGLAADTSWGRGTAWALYGFATASRNEGPVLLATAQKIAAFVLDRCPQTP